MQDTFKHKGLRKKMIEKLREMDIRDERVLQVMNEIPRHFFLESSFVDFAYQNKAFPIDAGQTISHPYTVAFQTELLQLNKGEKVLEIGTGSAYQTAVLAKMNVKVFSIERQVTLYRKAKAILNELRCKANLYYGDGYAGLPAEAPFDKIIVTAGAPEIPEALKQQLAIGGIMVIPVGVEAQVMKLLIRTSASTYEVIDYGDFKFVPMLEKTN